MEVDYARVPPSGPDHALPGSIFEIYPGRMSIDEASGRKELQEINVTKLMAQQSVSQHSDNVRSKPPYFFKRPKKYTPKQIDLISSLQVGGQVPRVIHLKDTEVDDPHFQGRLGEDLPVPPSTQVSQPLERLVDLRNIPGGPERRPPGRGLRPERDNRQMRRLPKDDEDDGAPGPSRPGPATPHRTPTLSSQIGRLLMSDPSLPGPEPKKQLSNLEQIKENMAEASDELGLTSGRSQRAQEEEKKKQRGKKKMINIPELRKRHWHNPQHRNR